MFVKPSDLWFFLRTKEVLNSLCGGTPTGCADYKKFYDFFEVEPFDSCDTQSFVGLLCYKRNMNLILVYKISQDEDNAIAHEYEILRQLQCATRKFPHFVRLYGLIKCPGFVPLVPLQTLQPTEPTAYRNLLLLENIHHLYNFEKFMDNKEPIGEILSLISQVFVSIRMMRLLQITHNDLHCQNILIRSCAKNVVFKYNILGQETITIPSFGNVAVIIDFGMGRCQPSDDKTPLLGTIHFSHLGYHMDSFSPAVDYVRFLSAVRIICQKTFPQIAKWCSTILRPIKSIDRAIGWDTFTKVSGAEMFNKKIASHFRNILLVDDTIWIENLQLLINRPLENMEELDINVFRDFFRNWRQFETRIGQLPELNYLFRSLIISIKLWRADYLQQDEKAVERIKQDFLHSYENVIKFHCPQVDYDAMICSLLLGASYLEGFYYRYFESLKLKVPKRGGPLMWENRDEAIWKSFVAEFKDQLKGAPENARVVCCYI